MNGRSKEERETREYWLSSNGIAAIRDMVAANMGVIDIAAKIGVTPKTFWAWRRKYPRFGDVVDIDRVKKYKKAAEDLPPLKVCTYSDKRIDLLAWTGC